MSTSIGNQSSIFKIFFLTIFFIVSNASAQFNMTVNEAKALLIEIDSIDKPIVPPAPAPINTPTHTVLDGGTF